MRALLVLAFVGCASAPPRGFHEVNDPSVRQIVAGTMIAVAGFALASYAAPSGSCIDGCNGNAMVSTPAALVGVVGAGIALRGLAYTRVEPDPLAMLGMACCETCFAPLPRRVCGDAQPQEFVHDVRRRDAIP